MAEIKVTKDNFEKEVLQSNIPVLLDFWATWCGPCRNEMPEIQKLYEEYSSEGEDAEVVILGAAAPGMGQEGSREEIGAFMEENGYTFPVVLDQEYAVSNLYPTEGIPYTVIIGTDGKVASIQLGAGDADAMYEHYCKLIDGLLAA